MVRVDNPILCSGNDLNSTIRNSRRFFANEHHDTLANAGGQRASAMASVSGALATVLTHEK
jgi:hypothetical protein